MARWVPQASKVRRRCGEALSLFERNEMSGSEFERENIVAETLSATAASKPADTLLEDSPREHNWRPKAEGLYDLEPGEGFLRRRLHRQHQGQEVASDRLRRDQHSLQPRTSRRGRRRSARRRRRRHSRADPARLLLAQGRRDRLPAAGARPLRHRRAVHAEGNGVAKGDPEHHRRTDQGRRPAAARLARRADRQLLARRNRQADRTRQHAGVHRPQRHREDRGRVRAQALHPAQVDLAGDLSAPRPRPGRLLPGLAVVPHRDLQGHVPRRPARQVLSRPARSGFRKRAGAGASALLDQHLPDLVAGASLPDDRPQRRNQHAARQRQLDGGAPGFRAFGTLRQGHQPAVADLL